MACVTRLGKGKQPPRAIDFVDPTDGKRRRIRLGVVTHAEAVEAKLRIEKLVNAKTLNQSPDSETTCWLAGLPDVIFDRIARCALCHPRESTPTLAEHFGELLTRRKRDLKPTSHERLNDTVKKLLQHFSGDVRLDTISRKDASHFRTALSVAMSEATVRVHIRNAKTIFGDAVASGILQKNPFSQQKSSSIPARRDRYVTPSETEHILEACPSAQWRLLVGLMRFAGLRCPSETHGLCWGNVDWLHRRLTVFAAKTDSERLVPIFPGLYQLLRDAYELAPEGTTHVVTVSKYNRHRRFRQILRRAGIPVWPDLFQTLRWSAESHMASMGLPQHAVSVWIGHSMAVSEKYYLQVPAELFERVTGAAESAAVSRRTDSQSIAGVETEGFHDLAESNSKPPHYNALRNNAGVYQARPTGLEPATTGSTVRYSNQLSYGPKL